MDKSYYLSKVVSAFSVASIKKRNENLIADYKKIDDKYFQVLAKELIKVNRKLKEILKAGVMHQTN